MVDAHLQQQHPGAAVPVDHRQTFAATADNRATDRLFNLGRAASGHAALTVADLARLCRNQPEVAAAVRAIAAAPDPMAAGAGGPWGGAAAWRQSDGHTGKR